MARRPLDELDLLHEASAERLRQAVAGLVRASLAPDTPGAVAAAQQRLGRLLVRSERVADLLGRRRLLLQVGPARRLADPPPPLAAVPAAEAVDDIVSRDPRLARSAAETARVYTQERGFALARAPTLAVTRRVQAAVADALREGRGVPAAADLVRAVDRSFTRAYAETVYRTTTSTAYTAGTFRMAADPEVAAVVRGLRFTATPDADVRPNHRAADGLVARADDAVWGTLAPPLGYNCRCALEVTTRGAPPRRAVAPRGARPDVGFRPAGLRPDLAIYGTAALGA